MASYSWSDIDWLDDEDQPFVEAMMMDFQKTSMKKVGQLLRRSSSPS